ncbi:nucleotide exchange factor GrpE [Pullulanibacillus sp. KACC 23026]|uniref:nucleotide exchange factor GrpE n=1 Tax=Pullulanibacillus sp. KACC 23026 TaxID=3028315 RepID=UPI0023B1F874|nr:nucleotide exchange factor GrpE [Pullulanibacillus sp. KACC 23026]WEG14220.1 nucleotide exchange factor GrpE [Pullulanibacillus sp. KACC 23026]
MSEKPLEEKETEQTLDSAETEGLDQQDNVLQDEESNSEAGTESEDVEAESASDVESSFDGEELAAKLNQLEEKLKESANRYLRLQADYDNFRRRTREEKSQERKLRAQELVTDLLPVLDNFKRALDIETTSEEAKSLKQGMEMVYRQLQDALTKEGVEEVDALNQPFDPNLHQAVMQEAVEGVQPNTVLDVFQAGYSLNGRIIRPAMVKVSSE